MSALAKACMTTAGGVCDLTVFWALLKKSPVYFGDTIKLLLYRLTEHFT